MVVRYEASVFTPAGWRGETVTAVAEPITEKRCKILSVTDVGGNGTSGWASRTGANRQRYCVASVADREIGKIKITSKLTIIE